MEVPEEFKKPAGPEPQPEPQPEPSAKGICGDNGWLLPDGKFYACFYAQHVHLASALGYEEAEAEKLGWIKISNGVVFEPEIKATQKQTGVIFDYCTEKKISLPFWLEEELREEK